MSSQSGATSTSTSLDQMLRCHQDFMESIFDLMRIIEHQVEGQQVGLPPGHQWYIVRNGGYAITRSGLGRSLEIFRSADWVTTQAGIAFAATPDRPGDARTNTKIPSDGLELLFFQARWLDRSPGTPVAYGGKLVVSPLGTGAVGKWEDYQTWAFWYIQVAQQPAAGAPGIIKPVRYMTAVEVSGRYVETPLVALQSEQDVQTLLVDLALAL